MAASAQAAGEADREARQGILPVPDFSGDLWDRNYLTGDWAGTRDEWAAKGIQFEPGTTTMSRMSPTVAFAQASL